MPTQLNKTATGRRSGLKARQETPMFTKEWSIPAVLTVFLLGVCGLIAYFTWTLMPPTKTASDHADAPFTLTDRGSHSVIDPAPKKQP